MVATTASLKGLIQIQKCGVMPPSALPPRYEIDGIRRVAWVWEEVRPVLTVHIPAISISHSIIVALAEHMQNYFISGQLAIL